MVDCGVHQIRLVCKQLCDGRLQVGGNLRPLGEVDRPQVIEQLPGIARSRRLQDLEDALVVARENVCRYGLGDEPGNLGLPIHLRVGSAPVGVGGRQYVVFAAAGCGPEGAPGEGFAWKAGKVEAQGYYVFTVDPE